MASECDLTDIRPAITALARERVQRGWSLGKMEDESGVTVNTFYAWQSGYRSPRLPNFVALAHTLGFDVVLRRREPDNG